MNVSDHGSLTHDASEIATGAAQGLSAFKRRAGLLKPMAPEELTTHMLKTYRSLRMCLLAFAILLPIVLVLAGFELGHISIQHSLSAYYWAGYDDPSEERTPFRRGAVCDGSVLDCL